MSSQDYASPQQPYAAGPGRVAHAPAEARPTPVMAQYIEIKTANPDSLLFYRMGDFYELFFEDAEIASRTLGIVLTKRGKHLGEDIPMCGVPVGRADEYLQRLIAAGHRVAVCEQLEDPAEARKRGAKSVVRRDVTRLVTPGTLTEEALLNPGRANMLVSLARVRTGEDAWSYGVGAVDISTGRFSLTEADAGAVPGVLARHDPSELLLPDSIREDRGAEPLWRDLGCAVAPLPRDGVDAASAEERLKAAFGVATLEAFGRFSRAELAAAGALIAYIERTQLGHRPPLLPPRREGAGTLMEIDAASRANLELVRTLGGARAGSLLATIDATVTPAGGRLMAERLAGPVTDLAVIGRRHAAVDYVMARPGLAAELTATLRGAPDLPRCLTRLAMQRGGPRDLDAVRAGIEAAAALARLLPADAPDELAEAGARLAAVDPGLAAEMAAALGAELPLNRRDGGFIRQGYDRDLDEARALRDDSRAVIAGLQQRYAAEVEARALRIKYNSMIGYFVEVPQVVGERLVQPPFNALFVHRQTMAGAMRFSTRELSELEARIASAGERAVGIEIAIFDRLAGAALAADAVLRAAAEAMAVLDVTTALAGVAANRGWVRPEMTGDAAFHVEGGRHPVVEAALARQGKSFVSNDCDLRAGDGDGQILLVTGPNMAGKSTYLRQNALIAILAQMGAFVPARLARLGVVDRLFSRVGAADDLARGRSTFMVEMVETAAILNQATARSLVILDEIGRGTATYDGLSIAWATIEHLHEKIRCRALFATHFHELTALTRRMDRLRPVTMRVTDYRGDVVFLHEVAPGAADRSYGIQVAKLAGLPAPVVERARAVLQELEKTDRAAPVARLVDDLPLFALAAAPVAPAAPDPLRKAIAAINPDELSPREALEALYRLKAIKPAD
jgi:DNA mismatch repair protein MutS